jgi:hypothetical protein
LSLLFNFALEYAIRRVQVNQEGLKLYDTHQLLVYADNILGGSVHTTKKNSKALVVASKETGQEIYADKTKYSRTPRFWIANYPDLLGPVSTFVDNSLLKKLNYWLSDYIQYPTVLQLPELQIRCGQNVETQVHTVNSNRELQTANITYFQTEVQLSGFSAYLQAHHPN